MYNHERKTNRQIYCSTHNLEKKVVKCIMIKERQVDKYFAGHIIQKRKVSNIYNKRKTNKIIYCSTHNLE